MIIINCNSCMVHEIKSQLEVTFDHANYNYIASIAVILAGFGYKRGYKCTLHTAAVACMHCM